MQYIYDTYGIIIDRHLFQRMLHNPVYKGEFHGIKDFCEPIIEPALFNKLDAIPTARANPTKRIYIFSGLVYCAECGLRMVGRIGGNSCNIIYYRCNRANDPRGCINHKQIDEKLIESWLLENIKDEINRTKLDFKTQYEKRHTIGQIADQKAKYAKEQTFWPDVPENLVSASELIQRQQAILAKNGENQRKRERAHQLKMQKQELRRQLDDLKAHYDAVCQDYETACKSAEDLHDESTSELERSIAEIDEINAKVRDNLNCQKAEEDAREYHRQYGVLTDELEAARRAKAALLDNAELPLDGLSVEDGVLTCNGQKWDNMSGSEQLKVSTAIVRKLKPECGFVLLDGLEQMDMDTLKEFGEWLENQKLQAIATRVSTGGECPIIITDGIVEGAETEPAAQTFRKWKKGEF